MAVGEGRDDGPYVSTREDGAPLHPHHVADARDASVRRAKVPTIRFHDLLSSPGTRLTNRLR
jgi:hypothetical protein